MENFLRNKSYFYITSKSILFYSKFKIQGLVEAASKRIQRIRDHIQGFALIFALIFLFINFKV